MAQDPLFSDDVTDEQQETFTEAWANFVTNPAVGALARLNTKPPLVTNVLPPEYQGVYSPKTDNLALAASNSSGQALNTLIHEYTHRAQHQPGSRAAPEVSLQALKSAAENGISYGKNEPAAWIVANMIYAPGRAFNDNALEFINKNRAEANRIFTEGVNPHLAKQEHFKGYPEMNVAEKVLNTVLGYQPKVETPTTTLPPWVEQAIANLQKK